MALEFFGTAKDLRTQTLVIYVKATISDYLGLVGNDFEDFAIQRRREKHKAYARMKSDLQQGALLPTITLSVKPEFVDEIVDLIEGDHGQLIQRLSVPGQVNILDGLQRTYILKDLETAGTKFLQGQSLLLEFWLEERLDHLIYRIIVLNAGQKPMSMRHQIELLFDTFKHRIEERITGLELYSEKDATRRRSSRKYSLDKVAIAFQAFLMGTSEIRRDNVVAQELIESVALDSDEQAITESFERFMAYLNHYAELDDGICRVYAHGNADRGIPTGAAWFGSDNVMNAFFAAAAQFERNSGYAQRTQAALVKLKNDLSVAQPDADPLSLEVLQALIKGFNPRKVNIGFATRRLITNGFKEYFREEGATPLNTCWTMAAE